MPPICNICGSARIAPGGARGLPVCQDCSSHPVTRVIWLNLTANDLLTPGKRVLHIAPERAFAPRLREIFGDGYDPVDMNPAGYAHVPGVRRMDLCADAAKLESGSYDLIIHSHVMEHVQCNVTAVLFHLHRALRPGGKQLCCVPFSRNSHSSEDLGRLSPEDALARFGQDDHVRRFGDADVQTTLGMLFRLPGEYDLTRSFDPEQLAAHAIPERFWRGWTPTSVLVLDKDDLLLKA